MKKANKIIMATVAILLSLVLITSSVVSGVFAKFAIAKTANTEMKLEKFGASVTIAATNGNITKKGKYYGDSHEYVGTANVIPGFECMRAYAFEIKAKPNTITTDVYLKIKIELDYEINDFQITNTGNIDTTLIPKDTTMYFLPLGFTFGEYDHADYVLRSWLHSTDPTELEKGKVAELVAQKIADAFDSTAGIKPEGNVLSVKINRNANDGDYKLFKLKDGPSVRKFDFGFGVPKTYSEDDTFTEDELNVISTHLLTSDATIRVVYTVWLEQAVD